MNKLQRNLHRIPFVFIQEIAYENVVWKITAILSQPHCVNWHYGLSDWGTDSVTQPKQFRNLACSLACLLTHSLTFTLTYSSLTWPSLFDRLMEWHSLIIHNETNTDTHLEFYRTSILTCRHVPASWSNVTTSECTSPRHQGKSAFGAFWTARHNRHDSKTSLNDQQILKWKLNQRDVIQFPQYPTPTLKSLI